MSGFPPRFISECDSVTWLVVMSTEVGRRAANLKATPGLRSVQLATSPKNLSSLFGNVCIFVNQSVRLQKCANPGIFLMLSMMRCALYAFRCWSMFSTGFRRYVQTQQFLFRDLITPKAFGNFRLPTLYYLSFLSPILNL